MKFAQYEYNDFVSSLCNDRDRGPLIFLSLVQLQNLNCIQ